MAQPPWARVRKDLGIEPLLEGEVGGDTPLHVERWVYQATRADIGGIGCPVLVTQLGGPRVLEGSEGHWRSTSLPSHSILVPARTATSWHYSGPVDDVAFYFLAPHSGIQERLSRIARMHGAPVPFADPLVAAAARALVDELHNGQSADERYLSRLTGLMLEQAYRALTTSNIVGIQPQHAHFARLQKVLRHINAHLAATLDCAELARVAGTSESHFRRIFAAAVGMPPHRYVRNRRLAQARKLLAMSQLPIAVIADECGFYSQSHLTKCFRETHAVPPATYRREMKRPRP